MIHYKKKREEELALGETNTNKHFQALKEMLVYYFGRGINIRMDPNLGKANIVQCQLCKPKEHTTFACCKLVNLRPKYASVARDTRQKIVA